MTTRTPLNRRRVAAAIAAAVTVGMLAACTPAGGDGGPTTEPAHVNGLPEGVRQATNVPTDVPNTPALRRNVVIDTCAAADGGWKAVGTAKNPDREKDATYTISVFFTTDTGTVIGTGDAKVTVPAGKSSSWTVTSKLTPAPATACVLRGVG